MKWKPEDRECVWMMYDPDQSINENARIIARCMGLRTDQIIGQLYLLRKERCPMVSNVIEGEEGS